MPNRPVRALALALLTASPSLASAAPAVVEAERAVRAAQARWSTSPHGPLLERILPPTFSAAQLPEPASVGARLTVRYCVQCHHLANPAMHEADKWPKVVDRMVLRMQGRGNLGELMKDMMSGVQAPTPAEAHAIVAYLRKHAQEPIDERSYPDLTQPSGQSFRLACQQCHVLPDPARHTASEWPAVVRRMERNMAWMNRVVGNKPDPREPQLSLEEINAFLARHARAR